jgi:hypothetical protein
MEAYRQKKEREYQKQKAAEKAAEKAAADAVKKEAAIARAECLEKKYTPLDHYICKIQHIWRRYRNSDRFGKEKFVSVSGIKYPYSLATQMYDEYEHPFDNQEGRYAYERVICKMQNIESAMNSPVIVLDLIISAFGNLIQIQPDPAYLFGLIPDHLMQNIYAIDLNVSQTLKRLVKIITILRSQPIPPWLFIYLDSDLEEFEMFVLSQINDEIGSITSQQQLYEEVCRQPSEFDVVQCENCKIEAQVFEMYKTFSGSLFYCRNCAPLVGIDVPFDYS